MKRILVCVMIFGFLFVPQLASADDAGDLKASFEKFVEAFNSFDHNTISKMTYPGHVGFYTDGAFPEIAASSLSERRGPIRDWFKTLESLNIALIQPEYKVIGNTGIMWGYETITVKPEDGPQRSTHCRIIHTFIKVDGKWNVLTTHMSLIPTKSD